MKFQYIILILLANTPSLFGEDLESIRSSLLEKWRLLRQRDNGDNIYSAKYTLIDGKRTLNRDWTIRIGGEKGNLGAIEVENFSWIWNEQYAFRIQNNGGMYKLLEITTGKPDFDNPTYYTTIKGGNHGYLIFPFTYFFWDSIDALLEDGRLTIERATEANSGTLELTYSLTFHNTNRIAVSYTGTMLVNPDDGTFERITAKGKLRNGDPHSIQFNYKYISTNSGKKYVESRENISFDKNSEKTQHISISYEYDHDARLDRDIFRMTHYGLPEPQGMIQPAQNNSRYLWLLLGACLLLILAFILNKWAKKPTSESSK